MTNIFSLRRYAAALCVSILVLFAAIAPARVHAQETATISGTVADPTGNVLPTATVTITPDGGGATHTSKADGQGHYSVSNLAAGHYTVRVTAGGFAPVERVGIDLTPGQTRDLALVMSVGTASQQVTVEADAVGSVAAAMAPMDALLDASSARTEITQYFIQNFTSPVADFGEAVEMAPGTFTTNGNGVGLGQSSTYFRGFADGNYDIDFDGLPFYDTNTPTHHSWAFFPSQWLGGIDFDRSPGTASTIGPTPFGGSIHLLSKPLSPVRNLRGGVTYSSFNTLLVDGQFDSGNLGSAQKLSFQLDVHHLTSDGYQTFNYQKRNAGEIKAQYKFSDKTILTGFSGVVFLDANTPNFSATRCQMYGATAGYTCTGALAPFAGSGLKFLMTDNSDPNNYLDFQYNRYHVPTDFEYLGLHSDLGHHISLDVKPYTYNYDNSELYANATPITEASTINGSSSYLGVAIAPCNKAVTKKGVTAIPCGVDKYNSYRKYGETSTLSQTSKFGVLRAGFWYEWADTNRHQFPSDPLNNWTDQALSNFNEKYWTNSYQPYIEYDFHVMPKLDVTLGTKFAYYTILTQQYADNGKTIGGLGTNNPATFINNHGSYFSTLPSADANYKIFRNWSAYGQLSTGSVVPPSKVFDFPQGTTGNAIPVGTLPKQQRSTTYQFGTVVKLKRVTLDMDYYHIRFQNSYSSFNDPNNGGEPAYFLQPSSISKGFEAESNVSFTHGFGAYFNATVGRATYTGNLNVACTSGATGCTANTPQYNEASPSGLWVQNTPSNTEAMGVTYQNRGFDFGIFNKRVGQFYIDNGAYHNQVTITPFNVANTFLNYTVRSGGRFDQTKIRLSINNMFDQHNITNVSPTGSVPTQNISANGTTYVDQFNTTGGTAVAGADNVSVLPGRSISLSVTFGLGSKR